MRSRTRLPSTSSPSSLARVLCARPHMTLEPLTWNTKPGACEDEPPVTGKRPLVDATVMRVPASRHQFVRERRAHDARADDDDA